MKLFKNLVLVATTGLCILGTAQAASLSISGFTRTTIMDAAGSPLKPGSIIQVGYFLGLDAGSDPNSFEKVQWDTFTALTGPFSLNSSLLEEIEDDDTIQGIYRLNLTINTESSDENAKTFPPFPSRLGLRIFDTTDPNALSTADYNTASSSLDAWRTNGADGTGGLSPVLTMNEGGPAANDGLDWEFGASPFQTVPEPSTTMSALLGLGLLIGARRRN